MIIFILPCTAGGVGAHYVIAALGCPPLPCQIRCQPVNPNYGGGQLCVLRGGQ